jgi:simple sugar transport system permease protein
MSKALNSGGALSGFMQDTHVRFLAAIMVLIFISMALAMPAQFPTAANLQSMAFQMAELGILSVAMTLALLIGGIDLSVTAMANLSAITAVLAMGSLAGAEASSGQVAVAVALGFLVSLGVGLVCGMVNGLLIGRAGVPAILVTLGTLTLYSGLGYAITKGRAVHGVPDPLLFLGIGTMLGIPVPAIIFGFVVVAVSVLLHRTSLGFKAYMLGSNAIAARFSGIDNPGITLRTHMIGGLLSAIAGIVSLARTNSANAEYGSSYLLMAILVAVLGGVSVSGGHGRLAGVVLALASLQMLSTGFNMLLSRYSGSNFFRDFAWGFLLLFVMVFARIRSGPPRTYCIFRQRSRTQ